MEAQVATTPSPPVLVNFFKTHEVDGKKETEGVEITIKGAVFLCRRAGGTNRRYRLHLSMASERYKDKLLSDDPDLQLEGEDKSTLEAFAESVVLGWRNIAGRDGLEMPFTRDNFIMLMTACPDLWVELRLEARAMSNFRVVTAVEQGEALGNS